MEIKLLIDEDVHINLAQVLRKRGYDAVNVQELDIKGLTDEFLFLQAIKERLCLFTFNVKDFIILHKRFISDHKDHYGIIVSKQLTFSETIKKLLKLIQIKNSNDMRNHLEYL